MQHASKHYEFRDVITGTEVKGGLSHANGNCIMVTRVADGSYQITDSKLGDASPVWQLSSAQFHALGRALYAARGTWVITPLEFHLGDGLTYTQVPNQKQSADGRLFYEYKCTLGTAETMWFTFTEVNAFNWGYFHGQFPVDGPVQRMDFIIPKSCQPAAAR